MKRQRKRYSPDFKQEAVNLVKRTGSSTNQIAGELGISQPALSRWLRAAESTSEIDNVFVGQDELKRLRKENERLRMERDILKKATVNSTGRCNAV